MHIHWSRDCWRRLSQWCAVSSRQLESLPAARVAGRKRNVAGHNQSTARGCWQSAVDRLALCRILIHVLLSSVLRIQQLQMWISVCDSCHHCCHQHQNFFTKSHQWHCRYSQRHHYQSVTHCIGANLPLALWPNEKSAQRDANTACWL